MKKNKINCSIMIISALGQNLAMAYDASKFQSLSPEAQAAHSHIQEQISGMSENAKLKLAYKLYQVSFKILPALSKMSDSVFNKKIQHTLQNKNNQDSSLQVNEVTATQLRTAHFDQSQANQFAQNVIDKIGYSTRADGAKKPLNRSTFHERMLNYKSANNSEQNRSIAEIDLDGALGDLLKILAIGAAVGLIIAFGWLGVSIVLGGVIIAAIIWLANGLMNFGH